ncbi:MAG TPA: malto-oligosyltrehalose trehalohydrolase [Chthoniobacterales bacterium]|nr:malto-oligosyltrehalose trehalohydrolase [Chthoniobacterales bacterium]
MLKKREIAEAQSRLAADERKTGMIQSRICRRYPIGAELIGANETHFRVWAPKAQRIDVVLEDSAAKNANRTFHPLACEDGGYFSGVARAAVGSLYRFRVNNAEHFHPDPASRFQPHGPHGPSQVVDPTQFQWTDSEWPGVKLRGQIIYEIHSGTFTPEGTWRSAAEQLAELKRIGITVIEVMPIADFPGKFGWGYDGVDLFAPTRLYGTPDDLRYFVNRAHAVGLAVILDIVYNHFGPDGNYLGVYSDDYLRRGNANDWGDSINFDGPNSAPVREFFITNGRYWIEEFHFDGFRFDATESILDRSEEHILGAIGRAARSAADERSIILVAENERQEEQLIRPRSEGGNDLDGVWNDDLHHSAFVALTGRREAYYTDYLGAPQEFISAAKYGYLFQGQPYSWQQAPRGTLVLDAPPEAFVAFVENHDQVSNTLAGQRVRFETSPGRYRAMTALLLLGPWTPLLFQGQEFGASTPFLYFSDVGDDQLRDAVRKGRFEFLSQFPSLASPETQKQLPMPSDPDSFTRCKLDFSERKKNKQLYDLHVDLMRLRREDSRLREQRVRGVDGAVLGPRSFVLRYFSEGNDDRLLLVNFDQAQLLEPMPEPLLAPPVGFEWATLWSSESERYGGPGAVALPTQDSWTLPAEAAVVLQLVRERAPRRKPKKRG